MLQQEATLLQQQLLGLQRELGQLRERADSATVHKASVEETLAKERGEERAKQQAREEKAREWEREKERVREGERGRGGALVAELVDQVADMFEVLQCVADDVVGEGRKRERERERDLQRVEEWEKERARERRERDRVHEEMGALVIERGQWREREREREKERLLEDHTRKSEEVRVVLLCVVAVWSSAVWCSVVQRVPSRLVCVFLCLSLVCVCSSVCLLWVPWARVPPHSSVCVAVCCNVLHCVCCSVFLCLSLACVLGETASSL